MYISRIRAAVAALAGALSVGGLSFLFGPSAHWPAAAQTDWEQEAPAAHIASAGPDFAALSEAVIPAVVRIESIRDYGSGSGMREAPTPEIPEPFRRFFENPDGSQQWRSPMEPPVAVSGGSGFVISSDGYIATNNHVVEESSGIRVWLHDGRSFEARLVGTDPTTDVAVIKIDATGLPRLAWGSSRDLRVGEWVMAVGNPGVEGSAPLDYTVTSGIVSAKGRPLGIIRRSLDEGTGSLDGLAGYAVESFIQTDAVINPGNSGGPLVDVRGRVVGINTAILSTSGYFQGYGFAVPSDLAKHVVQDLIDDGHVRRAWLGLSMTAVTPEDAEVFGLPEIAGVVVQSVVDLSPAAQAGLREGDVIVVLDGVPVRQSSHLQELVAQRDPGDHVDLRVYRDRHERTIRLQLGEMPLGDSTPQAVAGGASRSSAESRLGLSATPLTADLARRYGLEEGASGLVVTSVDPLGPAGRKGVAPGTRLVEVNGHGVSSPRDLDAALAGVESGKAITLRLADNAGNRRVVNVRVE